MDKMALANFGLCTIFLSEDVGVVMVAPVAAP